MLLRRITAIIMLSAFFAGIAYSDYVIFDYEINKEQVIEDHCVNKTKPELNCHGKCYLSEELKVEKKNNSEPESFTSAYFFSFTFYQDIIQSFNFDIEEVKLNSAHFCQKWKNVSLVVIPSPPEKMV